MNLKYGIIYLAVRNIFRCNLWIYLLCLLSMVPICDVPEGKSDISWRKKLFSPCCFFPCLNGGICIEKDDNYYCDCSNTGYYGKTCATESWSHSCNGLIKFLTELYLFIFRKMHPFNSCELLHSLFYWFYVPVQIENEHSNTLFDSDSDTVVMPSYNSCGVLRILPPTPNNCPTPVGSEAYKKGPTVEDIYQNILKRAKFQTNEQEFNLLFASYGFNFILQFSRCSNLNLITCSQIYDDVLRLHQYGKLKTELIKGEEFPVLTKSFWIWNRDWRKDRFISRNLFTYIFTTIWTREHNKICDELHIQWPSWDDDRLFRTAKKIVIGELLVITISEWLPLFGGYNINLRFKPEFAQYGTMIIANRLPVEIQSALNLPHLIPDSIKIHDTMVNFTEAIIYSRPYLVYRHGLYDIIKSFALTDIGKICARNTAPAFAYIVKGALEESRKLRFPNFNQYRARLGLSRIKDFSQLTSSKLTIKYLKNMYTNIDGLEFITGILIEESHSGAIVGETLNTLISNWLFKMLITHPIGSKQFWKPNLLGGLYGWNVIQRANLRDLICSNMNDSTTCYNENKIHLKVPKISRFLPKITPRKRAYINIPSLFSKPRIKLDYD